MRAFWIGTGIAMVLVASCPRVARAADADTLLTTLPDETTRAVTAEVLDAAHRQRNIGLQVAIMRDGVLVYSLADGFADLIARKRADRTTRFEIASLTKAFTGVAALRLAEQRRLNLDSPVAQYLPDFMPGKGRLTPRQLAAHQGGIRHYREGEKETLYLTHYETAVAATAVFASDTLLADPGRRARYSSFGFDLLAAVIERAAADAYPAVLERQVLAPLGLTRTCTDDVLAAIDGKSRSYRVNDAEPELPEPAPENDYSYNLGAGDILSTADDLVRFGDALTHPGLLTAESLALLGRPPAAADSTSPDFGNFGLFRWHDAVDRTMLFTTGAIEAYQAGLLIYPRERLVVAVVSNTWGIDSRGGDLVRAMPERLAILVSPGCAWWTEAGPPSIDESTQHQVEWVEPGLVSTSRNQAFPAVSPLDGSLWFSEYGHDPAQQTIRVARPDTTGRLGAPETAWFSGHWSDRAPRFSSDGKRITFTSNRPRGGTGDPGADHLWTIERKPDSTWGDPVMLPAPYNSDGSDMHGAATNTALWFASNRPGGVGGFDLYRVPLRGAHPGAEHLDAPLNSVRDETDVWVSPDESWMILVVTSPPNGLGGEELCVSQKGKGGWSAPWPLPAPINSRADEYAPTVSPDGKTLYFASRRRGSADLYRVPVTMVSAARAQAP
jgi:serine beta-lactamase-like protein LACTB, mitochondrial